MSHVAFPTGAEAGTYLVEGGFLTVAPSLADTYASAAKTAFQERSGWLPVLPSTATTHYYDPPLGTPYGAFVELKNPLLSITSIYKSYSLTNPGTLLVLGTDYLAHPEDFGDENPIERIELLLDAGCGRRSLKVTGVVGFSSVVPDDIWIACCAYAGALALRAFKSTPSGQLTAEKQGPVEYQFASGRNAQSVADALMDIFNQTVSYRKRIVF